jgi:hypothetical protein
MRKLQWISSSTHGSIAESRGEVARKDNTVGNQTLRKSLTLIPASRRIARSVPSAMSPEWCGSVTFLAVADGARLRGCRHRDDRIENQTF